MNSIIYALKGICNKPLKMIIVILQLVITTTIMYFLVCSYDQSGADNRYLKKTYGEKEICRIDIDNAIELQKNQKYSDVCKKLTEYIEEDADFLLASDGYQLSIPSFNGINEFEEIGMQQDKDESLCPVHSIQLNKNYTNLLEFDENIADGRSFDTNEYIKEYDDLEYIPVILGQKYKGIYKVGDILECKYQTGSELPKELKVKVIGILKSGGIVLKNNLNIDNISYLDNSIILPNDFYDNDDIIGSGIVCFKEGKFDSSDFRKYANSLGANISIKYAQYELKLDEYQEEVKEFNKVLYRIIFVISILLLIVLSVYTIKGIKEYSIHMLCGATKFQIHRRIITELIIMELISIPLSAIFITQVVTNLVSAPNFIQFKYFGITYLIILVYLLLISIVLSIIISKINLCKLLGEE